VETKRIKKKVKFMRMSFVRTR